MNNKTKKITITITSNQQEKARVFSKEMFGRENVSGFLGLLIEKWDKEQSQKPATK